MNKFDIYRKILCTFNELNSQQGYGFYFCGSISLVLQGVQIGRDPHDVDICVKDYDCTLDLSNYLNKLVFPPEVKYIRATRYGVTNYIDHLYFEYLGEQVDVFVDYVKDETLFVDGYECLSVESHLKYKTKWDREKDMEDARIMQEYINSRKGGG